MKIAITGSSGFIGRHLIDNLKKLGHKLTLLDLTLGYDICNWNHVKNIRNIDIFIHLANKSYVPDSYNNPKSFYEINLLSTLNVLELCRLNKARLIYLSSYVYGHPVYQPIDEKHPIQAFNPYAQSKIICENLCEGYNRDFNTPIIVFRPFNIYGPGQNKNFLISQIISQAKEGKIIIKDDRPKRDYLHVFDLVNAVTLAIDYLPKNGLEVFNVGFGISYSVREIIDYILKISDNSIEYICTHEIRQNEILDTVSDVLKIKTQLNWIPKIDLKQGLSLMLK